MQTIYGIAERRFNNGFVQAQMVATDPGKKPSYDRNDGEYMTVIFHWYDSKEEAESKFEEAMIEFYLGEKFLCGYTAKHTYSGEFEATMESLANEYGCSEEDITVKLKI